MKTTQSISFLLVITLMTSTLLLPTFLVFAEESDTTADSSTSADGADLIKVDAGNALNARGDARATDPADSDGDGYGDTAIREGGRTVGAGDIPEKQQDSSGGDLDGDGYGDTASTKPDRLDDDSDNDGIDDATYNDTEVITYSDSRSHNLKDVDKATPKLMEALSLDATTPLLYQGIKMQVIADSCGSETDDDCDDTEEQRPSASFGIKVSGVEMRDWNPEQKSAVRTQASEMTTIETPNDFGIWLADKVLTDESITEAEVTSDEVVMKYNTKARLLGFIPIVIPATATLKGRMKVGDMTLERGDVSEVEVTYPWYGFLARKKSATEQIVSSTIEIVTNYNASQKKEAKFKAGKALAETVK